MDKVITCKCGKQAWVIGDSGTRCVNCGLWLPNNFVTAFIDEANDYIDQLGNIDSFLRKTTKSISEYSSVESVLKEFVKWERG